MAIGSSTQRRIGNKTRARRYLSVRRPGLCGCDLESQNAAYQGTGGVSKNNQSAGFLPAYQNRATDQVVLSRFTDGRPAPVHLLDGVPGDWVADRDVNGQVQRLIAAVVVGFVRDECFYTREEAACWLANHKAPV